MGRDEHTVEALLDTGSAARLAQGADAIAAHSPDAVMWACTSGSFVYGRDGAAAQAAAIGERLGVPASSTSIAFVEAARALGIGKVAVAASYPEDLAGHFSSFLGAGGIDVVSFGASGIFSAVEAGRLGPDTVLEMTLAVDVPEAEAVFVPDTALHTLTCIDTLEEALGKPVLTANQVTVWEGLRLAGKPRPLPGLGALFR
ncbi:maleate cis-trans isomerase [Nocardioides sp. NPDC057577]|uniref:maleate cis-trans isomerase family protein n=1 Tax=Nocardioides sp. NPDC057577 TaxID=3346171 RepID=UPI003670EA54